MTAADPRDGLLMIADDLERAWYGSGPLDLDGFADRIRAIAHARPEAVDGPTYSAKDMSAIFRAGMNTYAMGGRLGGEDAEPVCFRWHSPGHTSQWYGIEDNREWYEMACNSGDAMEFAYLATLTPERAP